MWIYTFPFTQIHFACISWKKSNMCVNYIFLLYVREYRNNSSSVYRLFIRRSSNMAVWKFKISCTELFWRCQSGLDGEDTASETRRFTQTGVCVCVFNGKYVFFCVCLMNMLFSAGLQVNQWWNNLSEGQKTVTGQTQWMMQTIHFTDEWFRLWRQCVLIKCNYLIKQMLALIMFMSLEDDKEDSYIQTEAIEGLHKLVPQKVNVDFENTNITLSMHSQKR